MGMANGGMKPFVSFTIVMRVWFFTNVASDDYPLRLGSWGYCGHFILTYATGLVNLASLDRVKTSITLTYLSVC